MFALVGMGTVGPVDADPEEELAFAETLRANGTTWLLAEIERGEEITIPAAVRENMAATDVEQFAPVTRTRFVL